MNELDRRFICSSDLIIGSMNPKMPKKSQRDFAHFNRKVRGEAPLNNNIKISKKIINTFFKQKRLKILKTRRLTDHTLFRIKTKSLSQISQGSIIHLYHLIAYIQEALRSHSCYFTAFSMCKNSWIYVFRSSALGPCKKFLQQRC
ncbi:hypothetical protein BpHYR1_030197 [Brachionus plicatilis]|uniref:Uncharacterized protein n=1 Tax=Brachionus plicatilis TaxID=10195 RepID=A0A3M7RMT3_BRAPC|nr:hypothetical protein BpHYR1_030197 [Brachionus plicatilis]